MAQGLTFPVIHLLNCNSYDSVSEPCNLPSKPHALFLDSWSKRDNLPAWNQILFYYKKIFHGIFLFWDRFLFVVVVMYEYVQSRCSSRGIWALRQPPCSFCLLSCICQRCRVVPQTLIVIQPTASTLSLRTGLGNKIILALIFSCLKKWCFFCPSTINFQCPYTTVETTHYPSANPWHLWKIRKKLWICNKILRVASAATHCGEPLDSHHAQCRSVAV